LQHCKALNGEEDKKCQIKAEMFSGLEKNTALTYWGYPM
jgi:hypothetical protein